MRRLVWILALALLCSVPVIYAQETCASMADIFEACADAPVDSVCGPGDDITLLPELPMNQSGAALVKLGGADVGSDLSVYLIGVGLLSYEHRASSGVQVEISNRAGYNINLRSGPGVDFAVAGVFHYDETLLADGRSADGQWFRVQLDSGPAWIIASVVAVDPTLDSLPVVDQHTSSSAGHALNVGGIAADCYGTQGILISTTSATAQRLTLNDMPVSVTDGAVFVGLTGDQLMVFPLAGEVSLGASVDPVGMGSAVLWTGSSLDAPELRACLSAAASPGPPGHPNRVVPDRA